MPSHDPDRPNIIFILSDDQGARAMGCAGNGDVRTPIRASIPSIFSASI